MRIPKYRRHDPKGRNKGFVEYQGRKTYFSGKFNSPESLKAYSDFVREIAETDTDGKKSYTLGDIRVTRGERVPIPFLITRYLDHANARYVKNGRPTGQANIIYLATVVLNDLFGDKYVDEFGPASLEECQNEFIRKDPDLPSRGLCRKEANRRTKLLQQMFRWGVKKELVPAPIADALQHVEGLYEGAPGTFDHAPVATVDTDTIKKTLKHLPPTVDDMVEIQQTIGCRPSEICNLRWCDIDVSDDVWIYTPWEHKTEHKNKPRFIAVLPAAKMILEKYRHRPTNEYIFSPRETVRIVAERKRAARKTPLKPFQLKEDEKESAKKAAKHNEKYTTRAYQTAIERAVNKYNEAEKSAAEEQNRKPVYLPMWTPNQLRHTFATVTGEGHESETVQLLLGHAHLNTTEIYMQKTKKKIKEAARKVQDAK